MPLRVVEIQAYALRAWYELAELAAVTGDAHLRRMAEQYAPLLKEKFESEFWSEELQFYVLALDARNRKCEVKTSNAGHVLFAGVCTPSRAKKVAERLLSRDFFSGWGIRTLSEDEVRYNPMSYHNGSIWPHDNSIIAAGMCAYGMKTHAAKIFRALYDAVNYFDFNSLPELFCGFRRRDGQGPTVYPGACRPQTWAAGSVFMLLGYMMGIHVDASRGEVVFENPYLPDFLNEVMVKDMRVGAGSVDFVMKRYNGDVVVQVVKKTKKLNVIIKK